jgi:hypothetical protein
MSVVTAPIFSSDPNADLIRRIIEARQGYERLCGVPPTCIHVNGAIREALAARGLREVAGMKVVASPESVADMAICSRDEGLFKAAATPAAVNLKPARTKSKLR